jgi:hypothetical protein
MNSVKSESLPRDSPRIRETSNQIGGRGEDVEGRW